MPDSFSTAALWAIPGGPLLAALFGAALSRSKYREFASWLTVVGIGAAAVCALSYLWHFSHGGQAVAAGYTWISIGNLQVQVDLHIDAMTSMMLAMVTSVSFLIAVYSRGYMHGDPGYGRFFAEIALFVFCMCMLVLAGNFLLMFVFWEGVGLCSYLLIGFWYEKPSAAAAAKKAFVVNRIGDFGFLIAMFLIWKTFGSLNFSTVFDPQMLASVAADKPNMIIWICGLLFLGAMGKSAQFPLHVWLPDAMEGPTPVSALIHAATMVTAGVYLVARCTPLFVLAQEVQLVMAGIGCFTALLAALIALTQFDLKRILAYSTVSQLGFMFLALGCAGFNHELASFAVIAAMFHLFTHAFFKALLFLGAGSVMHAMGNVIDVRKFGGLRRVMPVTHWTFLCGAAALAGIPLFAGFWSKDEILAVIAAGFHNEAYSLYAMILFGVAIFTATLTAFYTFRAYYLTFWGEVRIPPEAGHHAHESPREMTIPLVVLAVAAVFIGFAVGPTGVFAKYLHHTPRLPHGSEHAINWLVMIVSIVAAGVGVLVSTMMYFWQSDAPRRVAQLAGPLTGLSANRFYFDEIYSLLIVRPLEVLAWLCIWFDRTFIDPILDIVAGIPGWIGWGLRPIQNGLTTQYVLGMAVGMIVLLWVMLMSM